MAYDGYINIDTRINTTDFKTGIAKMQTIASSGAKAMCTALATVTAAIVAAGTAAVTAAVKVGSNFEAAMSKVSAISGATGEDLDALTQKAEDMGASTKFSATEAAQALQYMAMAGWDTEAMLNGIEGIMNLAAADGLDLATTSDIVTDAITAFGLQASDSAHFADVLAKASSSANTNVSMLGESFKYVAPLAGTMGYSIEDISLALGLMANASVKGSQAGTSLKDAIANLARPTKKMTETINNLGLSLTEADGTMKPLRTVLIEMREAFGELSTAEQAAAASTGALTLKQLAVAALTGKVTLATAAQYAYNMALQANPIGVVITLIATLAAGYATLTLLTDDQTQAEKDAEQAEERLQQRLQDYNDQLEIYSSTLSDICEKTAEFQTGIGSAGSCLEGFNYAIIISSEKQQELTAQMDEVQTEITNIARISAEERRELTQSEIERLEELFAKEKELAEQQLSVKQEYQNVVKDMAADLVANESITTEEYEAYAQQYINTAKTTRDETIAVAQEYKTNYLAEQRSLIGTEKQYTQEWYNEIRANAEAEYQLSVDNANKTCADTLQILSDGYLDRADALSGYCDKMREYKEKEIAIEEEYNQSEAQLNQEEQEALAKAQEEYANDHASNEKLLNERLAEIRDEYTKKHSDSLEKYATEKTNLISDMNAATCDEVVQDNLSAWIAMQTNTELYGGKLTSKGKVVLDQFLNSFEYLDDDMRQTSTQAMYGMLQGLEDEEPALYAKADSIANNIVHKLNKAFDIHSPSRVTRKIFTQVIRGGEVGIEDEAPKLYKTAENTASVFTDKMTSSLSSADLVARMQGAVYGNNRTIANAASARVEHIISTQNSMSYQQPTGVTAQGNIENHIHIDGREAAIVLTPYISEELAFN